MLLDFLILLLLVAGVGVGFWKGVLNQGLALLGMYLGALVGRFFYEPIGRWMVATTGGDLRLAQLVVFLVILLLLPILLLLGAHALWGSLRLPAAWGQLDLLGGALLGAVVGLLAALLMVVAVGFLVASSHAGSGVVNYPFFAQMESAWSTSILRTPVVQVGRVFYYALLPNAGKTIPDLLHVLAPQ